MNLRIPSTLALVVTLAASPAVAGPSPVLKCHATKLKIAGAFALCLGKADAKAALKGLVVDASKCVTTLHDKLDAAEAAGDGACPDATTAAEVQALLDGQGAQAAAVIRNEAELPTCGDGSVNQVAELCDGSDLDGTTCESLGHSGGSLACTAGCAFDASGCVPTAADASVDRARASIPAAATASAKCEAGKRKAAASSVQCRLKAAAKGILKEQAPDTAKCGESFATAWDAAADGGDCADATAASAMDELLVEHVAEISTLLAGAVGPYCGDGTINAVGEQCDGSDFTTACSGLGYVGGVLACDASCRLVTSACGPCPTGMIYQGGNCWVLGGNGPTQSCTDACGAYGMTCNEAALATVADGGTDSDCRALIDLLHPIGAPHTESFLDMSGCGPASSNALGCVLQPGFNLAKRVVHTTAPQCGADNSFFGCLLGAAPQRACACD